MKGGLKNPIRGKCEEHLVRPADGELSGKCTEELIKQHSLPVQEC